MRSSVSVRSLVIGLGEVGTAIKEIFSSDGYDIKNASTPQRRYRYIHICFPYSESFVEDVKGYIKSYGIDDTIVIIHSTVKPGTTREVADFHDRVVYSPVRGKHPFLIRDIVEYTKFVAAEVNVERIIHYFRDHKLNVCLVSDFESLEFAKLLNTFYYFNQLITHQVMASIIEEQGLDKDVIVEFISTTGRTVFSYIEKIGGHCLVPNAEMLSMYHPLIKKLIFQNECFSDVFYFI